MSRQAAAYVRHEAANLRDFSSSRRADHLLERVKSVRRDIAQFVRVELGHLLGPRVVERCGVLALDIGERGDEIVGRRQGGDRDSRINIEVPGAVGDGMPD